MGWVQRRQTRTRITVPLLLMIVLAMVCSAAAYAQGSGRQSAPGHLDLNVVDLELSKIVQMLMRDSNQSIVIRDQEELGKKKVTATLNDLPFEKVLQKVVESVGGYVERDADGVYVISKSAPVKSGTEYASAVPVSDYSGGAHALGESARNADHREMITDVIKIYNTSAQDLAWVLTHATGDYMADSGKFLKIVDNGLQTQRNPSGYIIKSDGTTYPAPDGSRGAVPLDEGVRSSGQDANRAAAVSDPSIANQMMGGGGMGGGMMGGGGGGMMGGGGSMPGGNTSGGGMNSGMSGGGTSGRGNRGMLPDTVDWVIPYPTDNSLIVRGDEEGIAELKELIRKLDIVPKQVMIKSEFVEISTTDVDNLGIEWSVQKDNTSLQTQFGPSGNVSLAYATGNVLANLAAQLSTTKAKLVSAPLVSTMNNVPSSINFSTSIPYWTSTTAAGNGSALSSTSVNFLQVTTSLTVLPRISPADNSITMTVVPQISDISAEVTGSTGTIPEVTSQGVTSVCRVGNGETFVIGGLVRKSDSVTVTGIPFLKDLPLIGPLFRSTGKNNDDSETLIFVTPTIRPDKSSAAAGVGVLAP
jgi:type II secretory pathway component GspD/PulD (secretin)